MDLPCSTTELVTNTCAPSPQRPSQDGSTIFILLEKKFGLSEGSVLLQNADLWARLRANLVEYPLHKHVDLSVIPQHHIEGRCAKDPSFEGPEMGRSYGSLASQSVQVGRAPESAGDLQSKVQRISQRSTVGKGICLPSSRMTQV